MKRLQSKSLHNFIRSEKYFVWFQENSSRKRIERLFIFVKFYSGKCVDFFIRSSIADNWAKDEEKEKNAEKFV